MDIRNSLTEQTAKKILGSKIKALEYLSRLNAVDTINPRMSSAEIWSAVCDSWNYEDSKNVIRGMFKETDKYARGKNADVSMSEYIKEWDELGLGKVSWPFSQGDFDGFVQRINSAINVSAADKDTETKLAAIKYRRIKEINTVRNDFIETLIFEKNQSILPTLNHRRGVDFFIDGISYDQKVAKSPTAQFKSHYGDNWRATAIAHPELVAEYLYKHQDEGRFGADSRLLVVYIDEDVSIDKIGETINSTDLAHPSQITFDYNHKLSGPQSYNVSCFVILLHK